MRREAAGGVRPSYRSSNASLPTTGTPRGRSPSTTPTSTTVLVNLDVHIQRATIGRDISPADEDLIVLFRRNSKEVTSEPTRWGGDHVAAWNQHVGIQTSLLRSKRPSAAAADFVRKDYEIVLVALPSHSAVALFTLDFAEVVSLSQSGVSPAARRRSFRISPLKCRDLAATLEFDITWDYVGPPAAPPTSSPPAPPAKTSGAPNMLLHHPTGALAGLPPSSTLLAHHQKDSSARGSPPLPLPAPQSSSLSSRRTTTASMSSAGSDLDELRSNPGGNASCSSCRSSKRRLERKELQVVQLETFLKEAQRRTDALGLEADELATREAAEARNARRFQALGLKMLQELEVAFLFCASQLQTHTESKSRAQADAFMFVPQFEFMERVKRFHAEIGRVRAGLDATDTSNDDLLDLPDAALPGTKKVGEEDDPVGRAFDFESELTAAVGRNERLGRQLTALQQSMGADSSPTKPTRARRSPTDTSEPTDEDELPSTVLTMTEQLNNLERENFQLRASLQDARADLEAARQVRVGRANSSLLSPSESSETATCATDTSTSLIGARSSAGSDPTATATTRLDLDRIREDALGLENDKAALTDELAAARAELNELTSRLEETELELEESKKAIEAATTTEEKNEPSSGDGGFLNKIYMDVGKAKVALEEKVKQLNALLVDATEENARLRIELEKQSSHDQTTTSLKLELDGLKSELGGLKNELKLSKDEVVAASRRAQDADEALLSARNELVEVQKELRAARQAVALLESQAAAVPASPSSLRSQSSLASSFVAPSVAEDAAAVVDLQKQLKLARQEVMQLRYRSNQLESASEKLEDVSKEKRALQAKLSALEGQLYEQRNRDAVLSTTDAPPSKLRELEDELDTRDAQLQVARRELDALRSQLNAKPVVSGSVDGVELETLAAKVSAFEREIQTLLGRNEQQAERIHALSTRVAEAADERQALEQVLTELLQEVERVERAYGGEDGAPGVRSLRASSIPEEHEAEGLTPPSWARRGDSPTSGPTGRVADRYASALATTRSASNSTASVNGGGAAVSPARGPRSRQASGSVTSSRIAALMKNFSDGRADGRADGAAEVPTVKKPIKLDFRSRNGSTASSSSNGGSVDGIVGRFNRK